MTVLFVAPFAPDVGYAWHTILPVYRAVGRRLAARGARALFCHPAGDGAGDTVVCDYAATARRPGALLRFLVLLRQERVRILYLTDAVTWSWRYPLFRWAGVRRIVVHDRTSGVRHSRRFGGAAVKRLLHRVPGLGADLCIGISSFVTDRLVRVNGVPAGRTRLVYNGVEIERFASGPADGLHRLLSLAPATRVVFMSGRAQAYKGVAVLIAAAALLERQGVPDLAFAYCGDGPGLRGFRDLVVTQGLRSFHFLGRRDDVPRLLASACVAVAPAVWDEAFGLTVVEAMAAGVPVVASRVGGVPELVRDGETGVLVPPGDAAALADALAVLLADPQRRARLASAGRAEARARFSLERVVDELAALIEPLIDGQPSR